jgi:Fur family zinc uptake transcriptional regulator
MVLDVLRMAGGPLSAYDILNRLRPTRPKIAPLTIYRALVHLIEERQVHRIESLNAYLLADENSAGHSVAFAICDDCGHVQEQLADVAVGSLTVALSCGGFVPTRPIIEVHGRCGDCDGHQSTGFQA